MKSTNQPTITKQTKLFELLRGRTL